jgi:hypothetical protein
MKILYVALCLFAMAASFRFGSEITQALKATKSQSRAVLVWMKPEADTRTLDPVGSEAAKSFARSRTAALASSGADVSTAELNELQNPEPAEAAEHSLLKAMKSSPPVRQRASLHESMITPGNFEYLGAFRPPHVQQNGTTFAYGGWGVAYRENGDPNGTDDFPGSLFLVGHQNHQKVVEISIPSPVNSKLKLADDLPVAEILQPFEDVTDGILEEMTAGSSEPFQLGGLLATKGLLHWTVYKYYNVENRDYPSHGTSGFDMQNSIAEGLWHLGPMNSGSPEWNSYKHAGYIFEIPETEAKQWFGGRNLISGLQISTGLQASSQGPAMFAYSLPPEGTAANVSLDALPLTWYSEQQPLERHHPADRWTGGAWLTLGDKQAVIIAGRKSLGEFYYGDARPEDCTIDKGYHGPPYEVEFVFYSPASLIHAANGSLTACGLKPWLRWDGNAEGGGLNQYMFDTCGKQVGGMTYDRTRNLLYLVQIDAGKTRDNEFEAVPIIHVFHIAE